MTGQYPSVVWQLCWFFISPAILITLIILNLYQITNIEGGYYYSTWKPFEVCHHLPFFFNKKSFSLKFEVY